MDGSLPVTASVEQAFRPAFQEIQRRVEVTRSHKSETSFFSRGEDPCQMPFHVPDQKFVLMTMGTAVLPPRPLQTERPAARIYGAFPSREDAVEHAELVMEKDRACSLMVVERDEWTLFPINDKVRDDQELAKRRCEEKIEAHLKKRTEEKLDFERVVSERRERDSTGPIQPPREFENPDEEAAMNEAESIVYAPPKRLRAGAEVRGQASAVVSVVPDEFGEVVMKIFGCFESTTEADKCVPIEMQDATGVPQFLKNSGICWFSSLCCVFFSRPDVLSMLSEYMPSNMLQLCRRSLFDRDSAQKLRNMWWYDYAVGDDVDLPPEMDGRNGFSEFTTLCAKLKIPLLRYSMEENKLQPMGNTVKDRKGKSVTVKLPKGCEKHFMVMRFIDGNHHKKNPILRRIILNGNRYRFLGVTSGNRKCGHQIGWVTLDSWRHVMAGDADLHKDGIGPLFVHFDGPEWKNKWWDGCREMLHVAKFGPGRKDFCNLSPHNEADDLLDSYRGAASIPGKNSLDIIYLSV